MAGCLCVFKMSTWGEVEGAESCLRGLASLACGVVERELGDCTVVRGKVAKLT